MIALTDICPKRLKIMNLKSVIKEIEEIKDLIHK